MTLLEWIDFAKWVAMGVASIFVFWIGYDRKRSDALKLLVQEAAVAIERQTAARNAEIERRFDDASERYSKLASTVQGLVRSHDAGARFESECRETVADLRRVDIIAHDAFRAFRDGDVKSLQVDFARLQEQVRNKVEQADREHAEFRTAIDALERRRSPRG